MIPIVTSLVLALFCGLPSPPGGPAVSPMNTGTRQNPAQAKPEVNVKKDGGPAAPVVQRADTAKLQMKGADLARRNIRGRGDARRALVVNAVAAYDAVLQFFPDAKEDCAMAWFRLGELNRSLGEPEAARAAFAKVVSLGVDRNLSARALYETAHLHRRAKELEKAIQAYRRVATEFADETSTRDDSLYWIGMIHSQAREFGKAREAWRAVADRGADAMDRVRAFDRIAGTYIKENKPAEASHIIEEAKTALHESASEPTSKGARVKKAIESMSCIRALERLEEKNADAKQTKTERQTDGAGDDEDDTDSGGC